MKFGAFVCSGIVEELQDMLTNAGLEVYKQEFAFQDIFIDSKATLVSSFSCSVCLVHCEYKKCMSISKN